MQHYAALGGDTQGAKAVNLEGGDKPADVYTHIADLVNLIVDRDAAEGKVLAIAAKGKVLRKVVKQTVMTTVYGERPGVTKRPRLITFAGVTFIGAKDQIAKQLYAKHEIPRDLVYHVSGYLAKTVRPSVSLDIASLTLRRSSAASATSSVAHEQSKTGSPSPPN
jgi:DNA-directed RNA polymerase